MCHCECLCVSLLAKQWGDCSPVFSPSARESFQPSPPVPLFHTPLILSGAVSVRMRRWGWEGGGGRGSANCSMPDLWQSKIQELSIRHIFHWDYILYMECSGPTCTKYFNWTEKFSIHLFQEDPGTTCANATNVCYKLVWKDLPFSELRAPLDKEEKGRLIKEWPCGQSRAKTRLPWPRALSSSPRSANRKISYFTQHRSQWHLHWRG